MCMYACAWLEMADTYPETYFYALFSGLELQKE